MKITIIGPSSGGKTTLAKKISEKMKIPHIHLDRFWFEAGGLDLKKGDTEKPEYIRNYIREKVLEFIETDNWVSEGFYSRVQPLIYEKADQLIFLNIPLYRRLFNHAHRIFFSERHPELNRWEEFKFFFDIIKRNFTSLPKMKNFVKNNSEKVKYLNSYREVEEYFSSLKK